MRCHLTASSAYLGVYQQAWFADAHARATTVAIAPRFLDEGKHLGQEQGLCCLRELTEDPTGGRRRYGKPSLAWGWQSLRSSGGPECRWALERPR